MTEIRIHPVTGAALHRGTRTETLRYAGMTEAVEVPGWYPESDGDSIHTGSDLAAEQEAWKRLKAATQTD